MTSAAVLARPTFEGLAGAVLSNDGLYRYWLHRRWFLGTGWTVFVMLNPSTADGTKDDPTLRRCIRFAQDFGSEGLIVVNLFAWRTSSPAELTRAKNNFADVEGPENHAYVLRAVETAVRGGGQVICGWGSHSVTREQRRKVFGWIEAAGAQPMCLGCTEDGSPRHPLYVHNVTRPEPFQLRSERRKASA